MASTSEYKEEQRGAKSALVPMEWLQGKQWTSFKDNVSDDMNFSEARKLTKTRRWVSQQTQPEHDDSLSVALRDSAWEVRDNSSDEGGFARLSVNREKGFAFVV